MANETIADVEQRPRFHRENRKKNRGRKVATNQANAIAKFIRVPPRKARLVIDEVRGRYALDALAFLRFIPNRAAQYIGKVLQSAVANAVNNHDLDLDSLKLVEARVDEGPRMKRVQPRAQGRAYRILKRTSHISVIVEEVEPKPKKPAKPAVKRTVAVKPTKTALAPVIEETKVESLEEVREVETKAETEPVEETKISEETDTAPEPDEKPGFMDDPHTVTLKTDAPAIADAETK